MTNDEYDYGGDDGEYKKIVVITEEDVVHGMVVDMKKATSIIEEAMVVTDDNEIILFVFWAICTVNIERVRICGNGKMYSPEVRPSFDRWEKTLITL